MFEYTINASECQELFGARSDSVETSEKSYYRRKDISLSARTSIALYLLEQEGQYRVVAPLASAYSVSRTFLYHLRETARGALEMVLACGQPGRPSPSSVIEVDKNRLDRAIVTLTVARNEAIRGCSIEQTRRVVSELLDVSCSEDWFTS